MYRIPNLFHAEDRARVAHAWVHWANRYRWLDPINELSRRLQHRRSQRFGQRAAREVRSDGLAGVGAHGERAGSDVAAHSTVLDVEVLITAFRYRDFLADAVSSAQTALTELEAGGFRGGIVAVEDCGGDGSWELLCDLAQTSPVPMRVLQPARNIGLSAARNLALFSSRSHSVFVLDADNQVYRSALLRLLPRMRSQRAAAAYGPLDVMLPDGEVAPPLSDRAPDREWLMSRGNYIDAMALFDTAILRSLGGWDTKMLEQAWGMEDYELWVRLLRAGEQIAFESEPTGRYLAKPNSMSRRLHARTWQRFHAYMREKHGPEFRVPV